jgi:hypothetical protein
MSRDLVWACVALGRNPRGPRRCDRHERGEDHDPDGRPVPRIAVHARQPGDPARIPGDVVRGGRIFHSTISRKGGTSHVGAVLDNNRRPSSSGY